MTLRRWGLQSNIIYSPRISPDLVLDMLHRSTQQHHCSHPACYMFPEPPLLACYLQQLTHAHAELPFLSLYPSIAHRQQRSFLVP